MTGKKFGYIRVSTKDQNEARQLLAMKEQGIDDRDIFLDKQSGKNFKERDQYQLVKRMLRTGDVLYVHSLDRFGRNKDEIIKEWGEITKQIGADIVVLDMPLLDTTKHKDSLGSFISDLVLQILSWVAEEERNKIIIRQKEGIAAARERGQHMGRPKAKMPDNFKEVYTVWKNGDITAKTAMERLQLKRTTFYDLVKQHEGRK